MSATGICKPGSQSPSHSLEKGAAQHTSENELDIEQGSISSKRCRLLQAGRKKVNDLSKNDKNHGWLHWIVFSGFVGWWIIGAIVLVVLLALSGTILRTAHIRNVRLLGFFFWLAISWCSLLLSYITSWALGYFWFHLCQEDRLDFDDYQTFVVDIRHSIMLFLWAIISWALVPLFCVLDHRRCTDHWVSVFHEVLLVTFIFAIVFLVKSFFIERLFIKAAVEYGSWKQRALEKSFYAIVILLPVLESHQSICEWMDVMRKSSTTHKRERQYKLEEEKDLEQASSHSPLPKVVAQYVADIFQGNGEKKVYTGLLAAIRDNLHIECQHRDHNRDTLLGGLCKKHIGDYLKDQYKDGSKHKNRSKYNKDYSLALRQLEDTQFEDMQSEDAQFKRRTDILWSRLKNESRLQDKEGEFVTFTDLHWQIKYLGESLREVVEGQKNLKRVVHSLHVRASLFLCIPIAVIYVAIFTKDFVTYFSSLWTVFFGISFAIQDPVKEFVSACIFVFAQHPYDVGDLVILEDEKDLKLVATEIYLMHTTFQPVGGGREYHIPHTKLSKECIENFCRPNSHISAMLHLKFNKFRQKIEKHINEIDGHLKVELEKEVSKIEDSKTEASKKEASKTEGFKDYQKHQTLRLYEMPKVTYVPVKEEDFVEGGVKVDFQVKSQTAWIPRTFYPYTQEFRDEVLHYVRCRLEKIPELITSFGTENEKSKL